MGKIYFRTTAYNAEKTLARCVESVLNQTYRGNDIVYFLCDNASTDRTGEMIRRYAAEDSRIRLFFNKINHVWEPQNQEYLELPHLLNEDDYYCLLDADDAYDIRFLECLLPFMKENHLNLAICGNDILDSSTGKLLSERKCTKPFFLINSEVISFYYGFYHQFMRTTWGKIFSAKAAQYIQTQKTIPKEWNGITYGTDTLSMFSVLRHIERAGIYPGVLHHYYISSKSSSYQYNPKRFNSDTLLYDDAIDFLSAYGPVSEENRGFIGQVYANALVDTLGVINNSTLSPEERLKEIHRMASDSHTRETYRREHPSIQRSHQIMLTAALRNGAALREKDNEDFQAVIAELAPHSAPAVTLPVIPLLDSEKPLLQAFLEDKPEELLKQLLRLIKASKFTKRYDLYGMVRALSADKPLLRDLDDRLFLRRYPEVYLAVWREEYIPALDAMTGLLLDGKGKEETFLNLYLSLAAMENQVDAFLFGKVQLAKWYLRQGRKTDCAAILDELAEMGVEDNEELAEMRKAVNGEQK